MSLAQRIILGSCIFLGLALYDLHKNGRAATRWREYLFLIFALVVAMIYGMINDQITSAISWEYFYYAKELDKTLGPEVPPNAWSLHWGAAKVGMQATWSAGLIAGAAMLIANNPKKNWPQLGYRQMGRLLPRMLLIVLACAFIFGALGYLGALNFLSEDFREMARTNLFRPQRFMTTWGIHLGGYIGGIIAIIFVAYDIRRRRQTLR